MRRNLAVTLSETIMGWIGLCLLLGGVSYKALAMDAKPTSPQADSFSRPSSLGYALAGYPAGLPDVARSSQACELIGQVPLVPYQTFMPFITKTCQPVFRDDFSNPATGWPISEDIKVKLAYLGGEYQILVKQAGYIEGVVADFGLSNYELQVDVRSVNHLDGNPALVFDVGGTGYYVFMIKAAPDSGNYQLMRSDPADPSGWRILIPSTNSSFIYPDNATNHLAVIRKASSIALYANSHLLATATDDTYHGTWLGMVSFAYNTPDYDTRYDNFAVYPDNCNPTLAVGSRQNPLVSFTAFEREQSAGLIQP
jgi:hypothetical protein